MGLTDGVVVEQWVGKIKGRVIPGQDLGNQNKVQQYVWHGALFTLALVNGRKLW